MDEINKIFTMPENGMAWIEEHKPAANQWRRAAFANSVATLVTNTSGGYGGPSVREHVACAMYAHRGPGPNGTWPFQAACELLVKEDGPIFGPLTDQHRLFWTEQADICFDDDPDDIRELSEQW